MRPGERLTGQAEQEEGGGGGGEAAALAGVAPTRGGPLAHQRPEPPPGPGFHPQRQPPAVKSPSRGPRHTRHGSSPPGHT